MNKKILTMEEVLKNLTYDVTNICYKDNIKPIFKVTEEGLSYKKYLLVESGEQQVTVLTELLYIMGDTCYNLECTDESGEDVYIHRTYSDKAKFVYLSIDDKYWDSHDKVIVSYSDESCNEYKKEYTKETFFCNIPDFKYKIVERKISSIEYLLTKDTMFFVEINKEYVMVDAKILHELLMYLSK